jgi:hypothetical protein
MRGKPFHHFAVLPYDHDLELMRRKRPVHRLALVMALTAAIGCAQGNVTPPPPVAPDAPTGLVLERVSFGNYLARWTPPAHFVDGYEMQARINAGPFEALIGEPIDPRARDLRILATTSSEIHELDLIEIRLRAQLKGVASDWSNVADLREIVFPGVLSASVSLAPGPIDPGMMSVPPIVVSIENRSAVATEIRLERAEIDKAGRVVAWVTLPPTDSSLTSYRDTDVTDGVAYRYRISFGARGFWSDTFEATSSPLDVLAPAALIASFLPSLDGHPDGVHLEWTNRSATADAIRIAPIPWGPSTGIMPRPGTVPAAPGAADDLGVWPFWPVLSYRVAALRTGYLANPGFSDAAPIPGYMLTGAVALDAQSVSVPQAEQYVCDSSGSIHASAGASRTLFRPEGTGWESHSLSDVQSLLPPGLVLDASDHPHVMYTVPVAANAPQKLRHVWHDGANWISDPDVEIDAAAIPLGFAADPAGKPHVIHATRGTSDVVHLSNESGTWKPTTLPDVPAAVTPARSVHVAPDGTLYVAVIGYPWTALGLLTRAVDGTWSAAQVPGVDAHQTAWFFPANRGHAAFAFERYTTTNPANKELWYVAQSAGVWAAPELIVRRPFDGRATVGSAAIAADAARSFLLLGFPDAVGHDTCELFVRNGTWSSMTIGPDCGTNVAPRLGADGKLRIVVGLFGTSTKVPLFTER